MKVQGGAPGQVVNLDEAQEKRRASDAKKLSQKYMELTTEKVRASGSAPSPDKEKGEEKAKQSLRRFVDWAASLTKHRTKQNVLSAKANDAYQKASGSVPENEMVKGQRVSKIA